MALQTLHKQEKEQFIKLFEQDRIDRFEERLAVLDAFLRSEQHVTAAELAEMVRVGGHRLDEEFVRQTIELMCRYGFASQSRFDNGEPRYEHRHLGQHHDHMVCTKCRKIIEFEDDAIERLQARIAAAHGFHMLQHKMELYGIRRECLQGRELLIALDTAKTGERLAIKSISGGIKARMRLMTMGLRIGDRIEVLNNAGQGQLVIALDTTRMVIGRGLAQKIMVSPVAPSLARTSGREV